jgi:phospholipid transport system substrate-binding protein
MYDSSSSGAIGGTRRIRRIRRIGWAAFLLSVALVLPATGEPAAIAVASSAKSGSPSARIEGLHAALLEVMKNAAALGYGGREEKLRKVVPGYFDVVFMARKSLGSHWRKADASARQRYLDAFTRFMVANYAGRFDGFSGQTFETTGEEPAQRDTVVVKTILRNPAGEDVELNYRMREVDGVWKVIDVYLDGTVSELALRRSEFVSIVKREDIEGLIVALDAKIEKLAKDGEG